MFKNNSTVRWGGKRFNHTDEELDTIVAQTITNTGAEIMRRVEGEKIDIEKYRLDLIEFNRCNKQNRRLNVKNKRTYNAALDTINQHIKEVTE